MKIVDAALLTAYHEALNKLHKWRTIFVSWQLGTRSNTDGEALAVGDHRSVTLIMRAELNALVALMVKKGVFTEEEYVTQIIEEAQQQDKDMEERFPGVRASPVGLIFNAVQFMQTQKKLHFPP